MVTTRRSTELNSSILDTRSGGVGLLEKAPKTYAEYTAEPVVETESLAEKEQRMRRNLEMLLNYDNQVKEETIETASTEVDMVTSSVVDEISAQDEDICPTSTTMQFGDGDLEEIYNEMNRSQESTSTGYKLTLRGKIVVGVYSLIVAVIFALIVLNTSLLAGLSSSNSAKAEMLDSKIVEYNAIIEQVDSISNDSYVSNLAQNQLGMILGN